VFFSLFNGSITSRGPPAWNSYISHSARMKYQELRSLPQASLPLRPAKQLQEAHLLEFQVCRPRVWAAEPVADPVPTGARRSRLAIFFFFLLRSAWSRRSKRFR